MSKLKGYTYKELSIGMSTTYSKVITENDINLFAEVSGDTNPIHLDEDYARNSQFAGKIAHGMLSASLISTVIGTRLPGPGCVYLSQSLKFRAPVRPGDTVVATATITAMNERRKFVTLETQCSVEGKVVVSGEAIIQV